MNKLDVTDSLIERLITEVAPLVEQETGWSLELAGMRSRAVPKDRGYEEILLGRMREIGFYVNEDAPRPILDRLVEYLIEGSVLAAYQPGEGEVLVIRENVDDGDLDGLRVVLAHELVHRGQHVNHPEVFREVEILLKDMVGRFLSPSQLPDIAEVVQTLNETRTYMTLLESHAWFVQQRIASRYYPEARIESRFTLPVLIFRLFGGQKLSQYKEGLPVVAAAVDSGRLEELYRDPQLVFGGT
jgi:hypothetical protein